MRRRLISKRQAGEIARLCHNEIFVENEGIADGTAGGKEIAVSKRNMRSKLRKRLGFNRSSDMCKFEIHTSHSYGKDLSGRDT